jgi:hypothetical protein
MRIMFILPPERANESRDIIACEGMAYFESWPWDFPCFAQCDIDS